MLEKHEYRVKTEQMLRFLDQKAYIKAQEIADSIDWRNVKNANLLCSVSEIYEQMQQLEKSREILFLAYDCAPDNKKIIYRLGTLALKMGDIGEAMDCYDEFIVVAPKDANQYILRFKILRAEGASLSQQIQALVTFKKVEYVEQWAYELAKLYHMAGMATECVEECDALFLWFGDGRFIVQVLELKMQYKELTPIQQEKYRQKTQYRNVSIPKGNKIKMSGLDKGEQQNVVAQTTVIKKAQAASQDVNQVKSDIAHHKTIKFDASTVTKSVDKKQEKPGNVFEVTSEDEGVKIKVPMIPVQHIVPTTMRTEQNGDEAKRKIQEILVGWEEKQKHIEEEIRKSKINNQLEEQKNPVEKDVEQTATKKIDAEKPTTEETVILSDDIRQLMEDIENGVDAKPEKDVVVENDESQFLNDIEDYEDSLEDVEFDLDEVDEENEVQGVVAKDVEAAEGEAKEEEVEGIEATETKVEEVAVEAVETETQDATVEDIETETQDATVEDIETKTQEIAAEDMETKTQEIAVEDIETKTQDTTAEDMETRTQEVKVEDIKATEIVAQEVASTEAQGKEIEKVQTNQGETQESKDKNAELEAEADEFTNTDEFIEDKSYDDTPYEDDGQFDEYGVFDEEDNDSANELEFKPEDAWEDDDTDFFKEHEAPSRIEIAKAVATGKTAKIPVAEIGKALEATGKLGQDTGYIVQAKYDLDAQSEVGLRAGLTEEQKQLFSYFVPVRGMSEQLVDVLERDKYCTSRNQTSKTGNLLVIGPKGSGKTVLAVDVVKAIQKNRNITQGKVAIVTGEALNRKKISDIISKLYGGALIIEKANKMNEKTITRLNKAMERDTGEMLFVLEDERKLLDTLLASNSEFRKRFTSRLEVPVFINDELVTFGQTYAKENDFKIDEMGILALYSKIDTLQREDHPVTVSEVKNIIDGAIDSARKINVKRFAKKIFQKNDADAKRIVLSEKHFR